MSGLQVRMDINERNGGTRDYAWGLRATAPESEVSDELWLLYGLDRRADLPKPKKYAPDVTHELTAYSLDGTRIEFDKSLWAQKQLIPELPAQVGFQFRADGEHDALKRVQGMMTRVLSGLARIPTTRIDWSVQFPTMAWIPETAASRLVQASRTGPLRSGDG